jgi:hypothetical protein
MFSNSFVFIVNKATYETHVKYGFCATGKANKPAFTFEEFIKPEFQRTQHSLLADILNIQVGDSIFFYVTKEGFKGVYEVTQQAFFDPTPIENVPASRPFRILIKPKYLFEQAIPENSLFINPERQQAFWLWYFNKMRTYPRGCTPLDPDAKNKLIELLLKHNDGEVASKQQTHDYPNRKDLIEIRTLTAPYKPIKKALESEDSLRASIMKAFQEESGVVSHVFGGFDTLEWFANQVPYNISGNNIDLILYHRSKPIDGIDARYKITVVEMKKHKAGIEDFYQLLGYCQWAGDQLADREHYLVQPVLLANEFDESLFRLIGDLRLSYKEPLLIQYRYDQNGLRLELANQEIQTKLSLASSQISPLNPERFEQVAKRQKPRKTKTEIDVKTRNKEILKRVNAGEHLANIGKAFGISRSRVSQIVSKARSD